MRFSKKKLLLIVCLVLLAILGMYSTGTGVWVRYHLPFTDSTTNNHETINAPPYIYGETPIVTLGEIKNPHNAFVHLKLRFRAGNTEGFPNVFQTAPANLGIRMEINGTTAALIVADSKIQDGYRVIYITEELTIGQWYTLEVNAVRGAYIRATLDGQERIDVSNPGIAFEANQILVGRGFDSTRIFHGEINNISITKGNLSTWRAFIARNFPSSVQAALPLIANAGILFSIILYLLRTKLNLVTERIIGFIKYASASPILVISSLILFQSILLIGLPAYRIVVITYFFLFVIGVSLYLVLTPAFLKERFFYFLIIPINGLLLLSVFGGYFIGFNVNINLLVPALLLFSVLGLLLNFKFNKAETFKFSLILKSEFSLAFIYFSIVVTPLILCLISPILFSGHLTSPYRIGPDLATYAKMGQYLLDGGTWADAHLRSSEFTGMSPGDINRYSDATMSWPFMYYFRWGLSAFQASVAAITFSKHVFEIAFISMLFPYMFLCGLVLFGIKNKMNLGIAPALLGAFAFALNPNMLNLWYEGFYGNVFALFLFTLIILIFSNLKHTDIYRNKYLFQTIGFTSIVFAASLLSYGEGVFFVLPPFLAVVLFVDLIITKSIKWTPYLSILLSALIGLLIVLPGDFIFNWAALTIKQLTQEGGNGYMQPLWALPHEILGFSNIYLNSTPDIAGKLLSRTFSNQFAGLILTGLILYSIFLFLRKNDRKQNGVYISTILVIALTACLVYLKSKNNNYTYMKMYVFFLPILFITFWSSLTCIYEKHFSQKLKVNFFHLLVAIPVVISGLVYILQYKAEAKQIAEPKIALHEALKRINFDHVVMLPASIHSLRTMYAAIIPTPWLISEQWNSSIFSKNEYYRNFIDHKVYLLIEKHKPNLPLPISSQIVFQNENFVIIDSGRTVRNGINPKSGTINTDIFTTDFSRSANHIPVKSM